VILAFLSFIVAAIMNAFSATGAAPFMNNTQADVSKKYNTCITPESWAFSIWGLIYLFQGAYLLYGVTLIFRPDVPKVISPLFCVVFFVSRVANVSWLVAFAHEELGWSSLLLFILALLMYYLWYLAHKRYNEFAEDLESYKKDLWAVRVLLLNGIGFNVGWLAIAALLNLTFAMIYVHNISTEAACTTALCLLLTEAALYYVLENFVVEKVTRYTWSIWPTVLWALAAVIDKNWDKDAATSVLTLYLMCLVICLFVIRILMQVRRKVYGSKDLPMRM